MTNKKKISLSPILFNWNAETVRDFYLKVADEIPADIVYLGEVNCHKLKAFSYKYIDEIIKKLSDAGKEVVLSTLALVVNKDAEKCVDEVIEIARSNDLSIEANDISTFQKLKDNRENTVIGSFVNVYNEDTLAYFNGVKRVCLPFELSAENADKLAAKTNTPIEFFTWGRVPLSISSRCFSAQANDKTEQNCGMVCRGDTNGLDVRTLDNQEFLSVSGHMVLSDHYKRFTDIQNINIEVLRISPHNTDMKKVVEVYRKLIKGDILQQEAENILSEI